MLDILIKDAWIVDGSGKEGYRGCIGIKEDKIVQVEAEGVQVEAKEVIDGDGLVCTPGFIDGHSHADVSLPYYPGTYNLLCQGITTFAGGNCGIGLAPAWKEEFYKPYFYSLDLGDLDVSWRSFGEWLDYAEDLLLGANYVPLVGLNPLRGSVLGKDYERAATEEEIKREAILLEEALDAGAFGLSVSLDPGICGHFADRRELDELCRILDRRKVLFTAHTRHHQTQWPSEDGQSFYGWFIGHKGEAVCGRYQGLVEFMEYYRRFPTLRCMVAHLTNAYGVPQPHSLALEHAMLDESVEFLINEPRRDGCDVYFNAIPAEQSISSSYRVATPMVRNMKYEGALREYATEEKMIAGLKDREFRENMKAFINGGKFKLTMLHPATDPYWSADYRFTKSRIPGVEGRTLMELTKERMPGTERELVYNNCIEVLFDLLEKDPEIRGAMCLDKREFETGRLLKSPVGIPITDTVSFPEKPDIMRNIMGYGTPPVAYTIFIRFLADMCRDKKLFTMEEAIRKITSLPAHILRIPGRGQIKRGYYADLVMLRWKELDYENDFEEPEKPPKGIVHVMVNGRFAVRDGIVTDERSGRVLNRLKLEK